MNINELISKMTIKEKAALCIGASAWCTASVRRLGIPQIVMTDGPHGVRRVENIDEVQNIFSLTKSLPSTCFPTASAVACTWDTELLQRMGEAIGQECISRGIDILLGPGNNMKRTPLCGRNFEYFSEDPYLSGDLAAAFIKGVQSKGVGAALKHFVANNQEHKRHTISAEIDERTLREIYLTAFETAVKEAKPWAVMCAYNKVNGTYCSENNELLTKILREEWGFKGFVLSDWGAVYDRVESLKAGVDLEMPGPQKKSFKKLIKAIRNEEIEEEILDKAVENIIKAVIKSKKAEKKDTEFDQGFHHELARKMASESIVLLKNNNDILPLKEPKTIAIIGRAAKEPHIQGGGSSQVNPTNMDIPYDEIEKLAEQAEIFYEEGYTMDEKVDNNMIDRARNIAQGADIALLFIALPPYKEFESYDRDDMELTKHQIKLINEVASVQPKTVVILNNGSPVSMEDWIDNAAGLLQTWFMGQGGGKALADILFGKVNPSGKLTETFPMRLKDNPTYINYPGENDRVIYGEGIFMGYRYYDKKEIDVQFPFGYGLSYTSFEYSNLNVSSDEFKDIDGLTVEVDVKNTGKLPGKEIVQLYLRDIESRLVRPVKELKGFKKVELKPDETKTISFVLNMRDFAYYHPTYKDWITENGEFEIMIGKSSRDICLTKKVNLVSTTNLPCTLNYTSTVREWLDDEEGRKIIESLSEDIMSRKDFQRVSGSSNIDLWKAAKDTQLIFLLKQMSWAIPIVPDIIMSKLLAKVHNKRI
ncbi:glycoside hydrolase family 3 C-terminal domain-containing protein [Maledivibacter halophilus]|uniref:Beta-glucosidase n=1 Tax=Maledivibacter halophilus TaxID=36842 RepID=A0A1T5MPW6_9FIRM|nr:glycoside hydrolase family 3 C-terminal domain-containing protein [Maledivibacter halophilus]SKC89909.1 beta-glucosidase [Maledivibacter halophilus]